MKADNIAGDVAYDSDQGREMGAVRIPAFLTGEQISRIVLRLIHTADSQVTIDNTAFFDGMAGREQGMHELVSIGLRDFRHDLERIVFDRHHTLGL